jgi:ABC-type branched-subunit amino acid transport system substrate-binding protein
LALTDDRIAGVATLADGDAVADVTTTLGAALGVATGVAVEVTDGVKYPYHYQFNYNTRHQSAAFMELLKRMGSQKVGILHEVTGWGESFSGQVIDRMKALGMTPVGVESYSLTAPDVRNQVRNLQRAGTTLLASGTSIVPGTVLVLNALKSTAWYPTIAGGNGYHSDSLLDILPKEATDKIHATYLKNFSYTATKPVGDRETAYAKKLAGYPEVKGQEPNAVVSPFYDFLHVLKLVAENVKSVDPVALKRGFDGLKDYRGISGNLSFTPADHSAVPDDAVAFVKISSSRGTVKLSINLVPSTFAVVGCRLASGTGELSSSGSG